MGCWRDDISDLFDRLGKKTGMKSRTTKLDSVFQFSVHVSQTKIIGIRFGNLFDQLETDMERCELNSISKARGSFDGSQIYVAQIL